MDDLKEISELILKLKNQEEIMAFLSELFTKKELLALSKRWRILKLLAKSSTQREIAAALNVSLCNVTRGAKVIKDKKSIITKYLRKDLK